MATWIGSHVISGVAVVLIATSPLYAAQTRALSPSLNPPARLDRATYSRWDGAVDYFVPEKPAAPCAITLNGDDADWNSCAGLILPGTFHLGTGTPSVTVRMYTTHALPGNDDALYVFLEFTDPSSESASDLVVLMLDTKHTHTTPADDRGLCFRRNYTVEEILTSPTGACTTHVFPGLDQPSLSSCSGGRGCMNNTSGRWKIEVKLVPADFGLQSFGGTLGAVLRAVDGAGATSTNIGPDSPTLADPSTWANLTLGYAIDVALVLDLSGSMGSLACPTCSSKLAYLKQAVDRFMQDFSVFAWQADRISVAYFKTNVTEFPTSGTLVGFNDNKGPIITNVQATSHGGATAMGGGLQTAINLFADPTTRNPGRSRHIVLFSDGMQNVNPMVFDDGTGAWRINDQPGRPASGVAVTTPPTVLDGSIYKIHTLGIDATDPFLADMNSIAAETGGTPENNPDGTKTAQMFVNAAISTMSSHGSPQLLALRRDTLASDSASEVFTVSRGVRRVLLETIWLNGQELSIRVLKGGKDVTASMQALTSAAYRGFFVDPPFLAGGEEITAEGQWELRIRGRSGTIYEVAALVDEPALKFEVRIGKTDYLVGEPIQLTAEVTYGAAPVDDATITALVGKPGEGIGTLLSVNPTPPGGPSVPPEPQATPAQVKLQRLLEDEKLWRRIQLVDRTVQLKNLGGGKYAGVFSGTDVAGSHSVTFLIAGANANIGTYRRTRTLATLVRFGAAEPDASELQIRAVESTTSGQRALLHLRPKDRFGNFLGPDFGSQIHVSVEGGTAGSPQDLLDGGYEIVVLYPAGKDPNVTITVVGHRLFQGTVSDLRPSRPRFALSLHAGVTVPSGSFNTTHDPDFGITADAEYWWNSRFALAALFGYHRFAGAAVNTDLELRHISAALETRVTTGSPSILVEAGGGTYTFKPGSTDPGAHAGVGVEFDVSQTISLGLTGRLHTVFTTGSNTTFYSVQAGGRYRF